MPRQDIAQIPQIPQEIIDAVDHEQLAIFFGAGASMLIGCSSWNDLANSLVETCFSEHKMGDPLVTCINYKEKEALLGMHDPKKIITICKKILEINGLTEVFKQVITKSVTPDILGKQNIYSERDNLKGLFITTNIDTHVDNFLERSKILCNKEDFKPEDLDTSKMYHIHGSIVDWDSLVLTVNEYFDRYNDENFKKFLNVLFKEKVILFIGYGLSEFEVLDYLIPKSKGLSSGEPKHFILLPYYVHEDTLLEFDESYFRDMGVKVIPYAKDIKGYAQLYDIIEKWNQEILYHTQYLFKTFNEIKQYADNYDPSIEDKVFQHIKNDKPFESEFFKQLSQSQNSLPWLIPLKDNGYFDPKNNPALISGYTSYWNVMGVLENIAKLNQTNPNSEITHEILTIIDSIIEYKDAKNERILNISTDQHIIRILFLLPLNEISPFHFDFIKKCMHDYTETIYFAHDIVETIIPRLIENGNKELLLDILKITFDFKKNEKPAFEKYISVLGDYYLNVVLERFPDKIIALCGIDAVNIALEKIKIIIADDPSQFNNVWIPSIKEYDENADRYDNQIVHFVWIALTKMDIEKIQELTKSLLEKEHPIFKRIAISTINEHYPELREIFWKYKENPLQEYSLKIEVYELFTSHCKEFSEPEITQIIEWIETKDYHEDRLSHDLEQQIQYLAYRKKEWLSALLEANNPKVQSLFDKYDSINPAKISPPVRSVEVYSEVTKSPISKEVLLSKSNTDIVEYLNNFKEEDFRDTFVSTDSLGEVLRLSIIDDPQKFVEYLDPFLTVKRLYQYELLYGLSEAWKKEKQFKWDTVIKYINSIIDSEEFWNESYHEGENHYRNWIISNIAELLEEGTRNDSHIMDMKLLPDVEKILLTLSNKAESDLYLMSDLVTSVLNSTKGKIYSSMVHYSLCFARHSHKTDEIRWPDTIKNEFERRLDTTFEPTVEFSVTLGKYLPNLCYLDNSWVIDNINKIFSDDEHYWNAAFTAYLFYSKIFKNIYMLLKENGHYSKAVQKKFKDPHINERLVSHICMGYLKGFELLSEKESLINQVFDRWDSEQIIDLIRSFRFYGRELPPDKRPMVIPLWNIIISKIKEDPENSENIKILAELNSWISLVDKLTEEICEWLKLSVKYIKPFETNFIDNLIKHAPLQPKPCSDLFIIMIESKHYFEYYEDKIVQFVTILYNNMENRNAEKICNLYLLSGYDFLRPIYEANLRKDDLHT